MHAARLRPDARVNTLWGPRFSFANPNGRFLTRLSDVAFRVIRPDALEWKTRPHEPDEAPRHVAELSELAGFAHTRANVWRYEPGAKGRRHKHPLQEETFVVLAGTLSMYLGDPPERQDVPPGGIIHVEPGTTLQNVNHGDEDLVVYAYGTPPEDEHAEILDSAL
jgi:quercetin dioxygenase-like cupin family protein